jgi:hypothetical protein
MIAGDNDTSDKFIANVADNGDKLFIGVLDTGDKLFTGVVDTGDKLFTSVNDTDDKLFTPVSLIPVINNQIAKNSSPVSTTPPKNCSLVSTTPHQTPFNIIQDIICLLPSRSNLHPSGAGGLPIDNYQCSGSMTFWCGSGSGSTDPCL